MQEIIVPMTQTPVAPAESQAITTQVGDENSFSPLLSEAITTQQGKSGSGAETNSPQENTSTEEENNLLPEYPVENNSILFPVTLPSLPEEQIIAPLIKEMQQNTPLTVQELAAHHKLPIETSGSKQVTESENINQLKQAPAKNGEGLGEILMNRETDTGSVSPLAPKGQPNPESGTASVSPLAPKGQPNPESGTASVSPLAPKGQPNPESGTASVSPLAPKGQHQDLSGVMQEKLFEAVSFTTEHSNATRQITDQAKFPEQQSLVFQKIEKILAANEKNSLTITNQSQAGNKAELPGFLSGQSLVEKTISPPQQTVMSTPAGTIVASTLTETSTDKLTATEKPAARTASLRQDIQGQYLESKISSRNGNTETNNQQQNLFSQGETGSQQEGMTQTLNSATSSTVEQNSHFSPAGIYSHNTQQAQPVGDTMKASPFTTATPVPEEDILNQVIQRFQVRSQLQNSKMVIKLHPAELGELKIDIAVKDGNVKANFLAQSQHVQEILEKQLPKLREIMEQQGMSVDDIQVSLESDSHSKYDFFEEHFAKNTPFSMEKSSNNQSKSFDQSLEQLLTDVVESESGINVKV